MSILTGLNGTGKSTVIQALLLVRQVAENPAAGIVRLNGPYGLALGEAEDVLHPEAVDRQIEVIIGEGTSSSRYFFALPMDRALNLLVKSMPKLQPTGLASPGAAFTYLNAERLGPRDQSDVSGDEPANIGVGVRGEFTGQVLAVRATDEVREQLRHPSTAEHGVTTLRTQVEAWTSEIVCPIRLSAQWPAGITASHVRFQDPALLAGEIRPANIGFGVSYALPIIVAGLIAPAGGILIVENPEAHLHPAGQSRLGRFLG